MGGACGTYSGEENSYPVLVWKSDGTRPLAGSRRRWEDNVSMDFKEIV